MNNTTSKKYTFNLIDFLIILTAIALIFALTNYFLHNNILPSKNNSNLNFVLKLENVSRDLHGSIRIGDTVTDNVTGKNIGVITRLEYNDCIDYSYSKSTHSFVKTTVPESETIYITVNSDANFKNGRFYIGNDYICAGKTIDIRLPKYSSGALCTDIRQVK